MSHPSPTGARHARRTADQPTAARERGPARPRRRSSTSRPPSRGDWLPEEDELPARPRRRLLAPLPLSLLGVLLIACGFIAGVLVEKGQGSRRLFLWRRLGRGPRRALCRAARRIGRRVGDRDRRRGPVRRGSAGPGGAGGATVGQVSFISSGTLYVTTAEGNTVKVTPVAGRDGHQDREVRREGNSSWGNGRRHGRGQCHRRRQRRIDPRKREHRWGWRPGCAVRSRRRRQAPLAAGQPELGVAGGGPVLFGPGG